MKTILSWDVGIKNLAYCLICKTNDTDFKILKWGVINLLSDDQQKCQFELKTGVVCQEVAKYCVYHKDKVSLFNNHKDGVEYVCSRHKDKAIPVVKNLTEGKPKKVKKDDIAKELSLKCCCDCNNDVVYVLGDTNYCWCENHYEKKGKSFVKKVHAKKVSVTSCKKDPLQSLAEKMYSILDSEFKNFAEAEEVLIENQPTFINPKMKTISANLQSYFVYNGITRKKDTGSKIENVKFVSPSNKLKINAQITNSLLDKEKNKSETKNVYKLTKSLGVKYCKALISDEDTKILDKYKKQDDMCDAFLQGFQYLFSPMPEAHFKKLSEIGVEEDKPKKRTTKKLEHDGDKSDEEKPKKIPKKKTSKKDTKNEGNNEDNQEDEEKNIN